MIDIVRLQIDWFVPGFKALSNSLVAAMSLLSLTSIYRLDAAKFRVLCITKGIVRGRHKMPIAVVTSEVETHELKSVPGGSITIRAMSYGQKLERQALTSIMKMRGQGKKDFEAEMQMMNEQTSMLSFKYCIVDHNLTDENDQPLDLTNPMAVRRLRGRVGEEIEGKIDKLNNFEDDEEVGNS